MAASREPDATPSKLTNDTSWGTRMPWLSNRAARLNATLSNAQTTAVKRCSELDCISISRRPASATLPSITVTAANLMAEAALRKASLLLARWK